MRNRHSNSFKPTLETLVDRLVPSVSVINGDIRIDCGGGDDTVTVSRVNTPGNGFARPVDVYRVVENGVRTDIPVSRVTGGNVVFNGNQGNDRFENRTWLGALGSGGRGTDTLIGGPGADYMHGGLGSDVLYGRGGSDQLFGNTDIDFETDVSNNYLYGGDGMDFLYGSRGVDVIDGGRGEDYMYGRGGNDQLFAAAGAIDFSYNYLSGGDGADTLNGGAGPDYMDGGTGNDSLFGHGGNDRLWGYAGSDVLSGGDGDDDLYGGIGLDSLNGGAGNDGLFAGAADGRETLAGGPGADRFLIPAGQNGVATDAIADRSAADARIVFRNSPAVTREIEAQDGTFTFAAGVWTNDDVERLDVALGNMHRHTRNTRLLKTAAGAEMGFLAVGVQTDTNNFRVGGWNNGTVIAFVDPASKTDLNLQRITYHEFGHNWDEVSENRHVTAFREISGWVSSFIPLPGFTPSTGANDNWQYRTSAESTFARDYGKTNPREDMGTTWESYFINKSDGAAGLSAMGLTGNSDKWANLDLLFADVRRMA